MNIALIMGCARSGTSILGELIGAHPDVKYLGEAHSIWNQAGPGENDSHRLTRRHATPALKELIRTCFEFERGGAHLLVEKCPRSVLRVPFIREVFPEAKLVHIVRDGRDVACSLVPGIGGDEWGHLKPPSWQAFFREETGVIRCAKAWKEILEIALDDLATVPHFFLRYEDLVRDPATLATQLLQFLELPGHHRVFEFCSKIQNVTEGSYHARGQSRWYRNDHAVRVGRSHEKLTAAEAVAVEELLRPLLLRVGYLSAPQLSPAGAP